MVTIKDCGSYERKCTATSAVGDLAYNHQHVEWFKCFMSRFREIHVLCCPKRAIQRIQAEIESQAGSVPSANRSEISMKGIKADFLQRCDVGFIDYANDGDGRIRPDACQPGELG